MHEKDVSFDDKCEIKYLLKSYRTTTEIMNSANNITNYINLNTAKPVIRHGNLVKYISYNNEDDQIGNIENILEKYKENGYKTIAIICKYEKSILLLEYFLFITIIIIYILLEFFEFHHNGYLKYLEILLQVLGQIVFQSISQFLLLQHL